MDSVRDGTARSPGRDTNTRHRIKTYDDSILATYVEVMISESMLATCVDVIIFESTLEKFETAFKGVCVDDGLQALH